MSVVRYVALAALVVWLGGTMRAVAGQLLPDSDLLAYACGAVIFVALVVMKFVGPPPHAFFIRLALVTLMIAVTAASQARYGLPGGRTITFGLGLVLLGWYARE